MPDTLFSIITPTFNSGPKLEQTIQSVLAQNPALFEYVVMDGGSSDGTTETLARYGNSLRWMSRPDRGVYDAMNGGLQLMTGQFAYFLGAGDTLRPGILETLAPRMPADPLAFVYGDVYAHDLQRRFGGRYTRWKLSRVNICHQALFCARGVYDRLGGFDLRYPVLSDYVFNVRCFGDSRIRKVYLNEVIADFEGGGLSATDRDTPFLHDRLRLFRDNLGLLPFAVNKAISLLPAPLKEARYQQYRTLKRWLAAPKARGNADRPQ